MDDKPVDPKFLAALKDASKVQADIFTSGVVTKSLGSLDRLKSVILGGDLPQNAIMERRCLREPMGCGKDLLDEAGEPRYNFDDRDKRDLYYQEWLITGLCPDCQDVVEAAGLAAEQEEPPVDFSQYFDPPGPDPTF